MEHTIHEQTGLKMKAKVDICHWLNPSTCCKRVTIVQMEVEHVCPGACRQKGALQRISTLVLRKPYPTWSPLIRVYTHGEGALVLSMDEAKSADHFALERDV
ncbi:unnamed protein product [Gadus morhua 'NCC']